MVGWGLRRQISILSLLFFVAAIFGLSLYLFALRPVPSCTDGIKNQSEIEVDCGGECAKVCASEVTPLVVHWTRYFKVQDGMYDLGALVSNPNVGFGISALPYSLRIFDSKNVMLAESKGVTYVNDKEQFVVFASNVNAGYRTPARAVIELGEFEWARIPANQVKPKFSLDNKQYVSEPASRLTATLENLELYALYDVDATAALFDDKGNVLGISATQIQDMPKTSKTELVFTWPEIVTPEPSLTTIYPRVNGFANR